MTHRPLRRVERKICIRLGIYLSALLGLALAALLFALWVRPSVIICIWDAVLFSAIGGTFGGALRALIMLISETGVHRGATVDANDPLLYLTRWSHYVLKPFIGLGTGLLFYLALKYAALPALGASKAETETGALAVFFFSAVGGIFFEEVMQTLRKLASANDRGEGPPPPGRKAA
jgi:hypothetical protein